MGIMAIFGTSGSKRSQRGVRAEACTVAIPFPLDDIKKLIFLIRYIEIKGSFPTEFPAGTSAHYFVYVFMYLVFIASFIFS